MEPPKPGSAPSLTEQSTLEVGLGLGLGSGLRLGFRVRVGRKILLGLGVVEVFDAVLEQCCGSDLASILLANLFQS